MRQNLCAAALLLQVRAHQLVLPPCEVVIKAVSEYVSSIKDLGNLDAIARDVFKQSQVGHGGTFRALLGISFYHYIYEVGIRFDLKIHLHIPPENV